MTTARIPLYYGGDVVAYATVDAADAGLATFRWLTAHPHRLSDDWTYPTASLPGRGRISMHQTIAGLAKGEKRVVHHRNGDPLDNRRSNLEICADAQAHLLNHKERVAKAVAT